MKRKTTRLTFTEEELADKGVRRAARKAARAADRADKAKAKLSTRAPPKRGLKMETDKAKERSAQLRFGKAEFGDEITKPKRRKPGAEALAGGEAHRQIDKQNQDENTGVQAAHEGERLAEGAAKKLKDAKYSKKLKAYKKAEKLDKAADKANIRALHRKQQAAQPASNPISRWKQRQQIKASYYARKSGGKAGGSAANSARSAATKKAKAAAAKTARFVSTHAHMILMGGILALVILVIFSFVTSCSEFFPGGTGTVWTTSYTAEDEDILGAESDYCQMEAALKAEIEVKDPAFTTICVLADKEEIGSYGITGMGSTYTFDWLRQLCRMQGADDIRAFRASLCLSADVTAAYDPTWSSAFEPQNGTYAGRGVAFFKYTGSRGKSGANDASAEQMGYLTRMMDAAGVAWQIGELGRIDLGGGGTVATEVAHSGIAVVDIGVPVLSMHSPFEVVSKNDLYMAYRAFSTFMAAEQ